MIKKIKKKLKNIGMSIIAFMTILAGIPLPIHAAANITVGANTGYSVSVINADGVHSEWNANYQTILINGEYGFCVDPGYVLSPGSDFSPSTYEARQIAIIAYEGWENSNHTMEDYLATQFMIWETLGGRITSTSFSAYGSYKSNIQNKINHHNDQPSFNTNEVTLNVGQSITLTDTNGLFENYTLLSDGGLDISKNGNSLTITGTVDSPDNAKIIYQKIPSKCVGTSVVYKKSGSQSAAKLYVSDPLTMNINVKVNKFGSLSITKQDDLGNNVPNTSFKLSKNADMSNPIGTYTTGTNGTVQVDQLLPATYYVQEVSVPSHLILDSTVRSIEVKPNETSDFNANNKWKRGYIQVVKKDVDSGKTVVKANTTFSVYKNDGTFVQDITTNNNGTAKTNSVLYGEYYLIEKNAPNGYTNSTDRLAYSISEDGKTYSKEISNKRVSGTINLTKQDSVTGNNSQGDATLQGAVYELKAKAPILDPADGTVLYNKDAVITTLTTDKTASASVSNLYLGEYYLKEKTPSDGYTLDPTEYNVTLSYENQNVSVITKKQTVKEKVIDGDFKVTKIIKVDPDHNEIHKPEKDAEFIAVLKKYVDKYGSVQEAYKHKAEFSNKEYDVLTTDKDGEAISKKLAYGTYIVQQTKVGDENVDILEKPFEVKIETENQPTIKYVISNQKFRSYLQIVKKDAETGKTVTLSNTSFKVFDIDNGKYLSQRVGLFRHDTWTTDSTGTVTLPLKVPAGNYRLEEIKAPAGYLLNTDKINFYMKESNVSIVDDENEPIQIVEFNNAKPVGNIKLTKTDKDTTKALSGVQYQLSAAEDIIDPADGSVIYKKGSPVSMGNSKNGYYLTNELGVVEVNGLPLGSYTWKETKALDGYVKDEKTYTFELKQENDTQTIYTNKQEFTNQKTKVEILKEDVKNNALAGATLHLEDENGNIIKEWISKKEALKLEGLNVNEKYTLYEDEAPEGYIISKPISFKVKNTNEVQEIEMIDNQIAASKTDKGGSLLSGAKLQVVSTKTKDIVDEWITTKDVHYISNLLEGEKYILREIEAPKGYVLAKDITFTASDKKEIQTISMIDKQVMVEKTNNDNSNIKGASLQVVDQDNHIIDSWISDGKGHFVSGLEIDKEYTLQEVEAPTSYVKSKDVKFTVSNKNETQSIKMIDKQVSVSKLDEDKKVLAGAKLQVVSTKTKDIVDEWTTTEDVHYISNLVEGQSYILHELEAPDGLLLADDIELQ